MAKTHSCPICNRTGFSSMDSLIEHIKKEHVGKLSEGSIEYLLLQGIKPDHIVEFCRSNGIKVDKSKVYKVALRLVKEGSFK